MVANAEYDHYEMPDERHPDRGGQDVYYAALAMGGTLYSVKLKLDVVTETERSQRQAQENVRYKDHKLTEIEIASVQDRGVSKNGQPAQGTDAISEVRLGVLRGGVKPSGIDGGTLYQRQAASPAPGRENRLAARFAALPPVEADSSQWFGEGKAIDGTPETLRESVKAWAKQRYPEGMSVTNADRGWDVRITPRGIKASLSHGFDETLARSVPFIPQIVEGGIHVASIEKKPGLVSHIFANRIRLDGKEYVVGFVLREDDNGNRFYDHELTQIISPDRLAPRPQREATAEQWTDQEHGTPERQELLTNRGTVMEILRERLGVKDGTGSVLFQDENAASPRASVTFAPDGGAVIRIFKGADLSSIPHEAAHVFVDGLRRVRVEPGTRDNAPVDGNAALFQPTREDIRAGDEALKRDAAAWAGTVDGLGKKPKNPQLMLSQTPLVMHLLGADFRKVYAAPHMFDGMFPGNARAGHNTHPNIDAGVLKQIPAALADPIAVFAQGNGRPLYILDAKDTKGEHVLLPIQLDGDVNFATAHIATTAYSKDTYARLLGWIKNHEKDLRYVNTKKIGRLNTSAGANSLWVLSDDLLSRVYTEADLVKLREGNPTLYQRQAASPAPVRENRLAARFAALPPVEADSSQWFGEGKAIDGTPETLRESVKAWAKQRYPEGMTVTNADRGWDVRITPSGIKASLSHGFDETLARSVPFIPQLVEGGIHVASIEKKPGLVSHIFANRIRLDGKEYVVGFVLREDRNNNRFYDHELTQIIDPDRLIPSRDTSEEALGHWARANQGTVMEILRERLGVKDGTGRRHSL